MTETFEDSMNDWANDSTIGRSEERMGESFGGSMDGSVTFLTTRRTVGRFGERCLDLELLQKLASRNCLGPSLK